MSVNQYKATYSIEKTKERVNAITFFSALSKRRLVRVM